MDRVRAVAADAETVEHGNSHRRNKVAVRRAADLRFVELKPQKRRDRACFFKQLNDGRRAFEGEAISDVLASVLKSDPAWSSALPEGSAAGSRVNGRN